MAILQLLSRCGRIGRGANQGDDGGEVDQVPASRPSRIVVLLALA